MSEALPKSVIKISHGQELPPNGSLEPYELGYVSGPGGKILVIGDAEKNTIPIWSQYSYSATKIIHENGSLVSLGGDTKPIYLSNGQFVACAGNQISGNADSASAWKTATTIQVNLESSDSAQLIGGEKETVLIGTTGVLPVSRGGTGATTASGVAGVISGQTITPIKIRLDNDENYQHYKDGNYALHMYNNDLIGVNGLYFQGASSSSNNASRGIHFCHSGNASNDAATWDSLFSQGGVLYFAPNHARGSALATGVAKNVFYNGGPGGFLNSRLTVVGGTDVSFSSSCDPGLVVRAGDYQLMMDGNEILCSKSAQPAKARALWLNGNIAIPPVSWGTGAPSKETIGLSDDTLSTGTIYFQVVS